MKKLILSIFLIGVISNGYSQTNNTNSIFVKAGISSNSINDVGLKEKTLSPVIGIGANIGGKISFQPELLLSLYKLDISNSGYSGVSNESYIYNGSVIRVSLPLLTRYNIYDKINVLLGITPSLVLINKNKGTTSQSIAGTQQPSRGFEKGSSFNGALTLGASYIISDKIFVGIRYNLTPNFLTDKDDTVIHSTSEFKLHEKNSIQISLGYNLFK